jgi:hypothetical protein
MGTSSASFLLSENFRPPWSPPAGAPQVKIFSLGWTPHTQFKSNQISSKNQDPDKLKTALKREWRRELSFIQ